MTIFRLLSGLLSELAHDHFISVDCHVEELLNPLLEVRVQVAPVGGDVATQVGEVVRDAAPGVGLVPAARLELGQLGRAEQTVELLLDANAVEERPRSEERRVGKECRSRWSPY